MPSAQGQDLSWTSIISTTVSRLATMCPDRANMSIVACSEPLKEVGADAAEPRIVVLHLSPAVT